MRWRLLLGLCFVCWAAFSVNAQNSTEDLGKITKEAEAAVRRVRVTSSQPQLERLLQRAFGVHGAFEVRSSGAVHFTFDFEPVDTTAVRLTIRSGDDTLLTQTVSGSELSDAALTAADLAVQRTTGLPGFFSGMVASIGVRGGSPAVYLSDLFFTRTRQLTQEKAQCMAPNLSPDGKSLLYTSYHRNGFPDIYRIDLRTNRRDLFMSFRGLNTGATYSPDGSEIAMILSGAGNSEVYVSDGLGRNLRRLTRTSGLESDPSWSPDGSRLVFQSDDLGKPQIFVMRADGTGRTRLPTNISGNCSEPVWNPVNPDQIVFTAALGGEFELCIYEFSKRASRILTRGAGDAVEAVWMPDGRHVIYTERTRRSNRLALLDTVSGKKSHLTSAEMGRFSMAAFSSVSIF